MIKILNLILTATMAAALWGCSSSDSQETPAAGDDPATAPIPVAVTTLNTGTVPSLIYAWGTVEPRQKADILCGVSGTVTATRVRLGSRVKQGARLLEIDPQVYKALAGEAEANLAKAEQSVSKTAKDLERHENLFSREEISETQVEGARLDAKTAEAELARAQAMHSRALTDYRDARPVAPFAGTVANRPPDPGTSVNLAQLLVRIVDITKVLVVAEVSEQDLHKLEKGMRAEVLVEGSDVAFEGKVIGIGPEASPESRQFPVEIEVVNPAGQPLKAGMIGRVSIQTALYTDVPLIPVDAILEREGETGIFTLKNDLAAWTPVTLGPRDGKVAASLSGAAGGDTVVVRGQTRLAPGSLVSVEERL